jgi:glycosyltransferase involved in cell wall biosynthesis
MINTEIQSDNLHSRNMVLFFSYGVSLSLWDKLGIIDREIDIAQRLRQNLSSFSFVTYGVDDKARYANSFKDIMILDNKYHFSIFFYSILIPIIHYKVLAKAEIYKINQLTGSFPAIIAKLIFRKKLVIRCGYQLSQFFFLQKERKIKIWIANILEFIAYNLSDLIIVTTNEDKIYIIRRYKIRQDKIKVIPNGVNTEVFKKDGKAIKQKGRIIFVGRLVKQKNLFSLIEAIRELPDVSLCIVGQGPLKPFLSQLINKYNVRVEIKDAINNYSLPEELNKSELFILPSFFEGNPKVLLEAMACGLPVIATNVFGNNTLIRHKENGILCGVSAGELRFAIENLLREREFMKILGEKAREFVLLNFTLNNIIKKELNYLSSIF